MPLRFFKRFFQTQSTDFIKLIALNIKSFASLFFVEASQHGKSRLQLIIMMTSQSKEKFYKSDNKKVANY